MKDSHSSNIHPEVLRYIEFCRLALGLEQKLYRILDFGCGTGEVVSWLRHQGYDAVGADISSDAIARGRDAHAAAGLGSPHVLAVIGEDGRTPFADGSFDFVFSQQVFEHVVDLNVVTHEVYRVTRSGGMGFHVLPAPRRLVEGHYFIPFVHWLPKNRARHAAIVAFSFLGIGSHPPQIPGAGPRQRADFQYRYSVNETFYRTSQEIADTLRHAGLDVCHVTANHRSVRARDSITRVIDKPLVNTAFRWGVETFVSIALMTRRPTGRGDPRLVQLDGWTGKWLSANRDNSG